MNASRSGVGAASPPPTPRVLDCAGRTLDLSRPRVMGILNITPDSFYDGGRFATVKAAVEHAVGMVEEGADLIDIGGESTRPGAQDVGAADEIRRVEQVIQTLAREIEVPISIDTRKPAVMKAAVEAGAGLINDIRALQEPGALSLAVALGVPVCLMHMYGEPKTMQTAPHYEDVVHEVEAFLLARAGACIEAGMDPDDILLDPGIGFGKTLDHNLALMRAIGRFIRHGYPVLIGVSRKTMIGQLLEDRPVEDRIFGSIGAAVTAALSGARVLRVHDVRETVDALKVAWSITHTEA